MNYWIAPDIIHHDKASYEIVQQICTFMKVQYDRVRGDSQKMDVVLCRKVISYFLRKKRKAGYEAIADLLGYKDHTNIMYNIKWINEQMPINYEVRLLIENVDYELKFTAK